MKPKSWNTLPSSLLEKILWDCDLSYDRYDSSKSETIHDILNNRAVGDENRRIIDTAWKFISEETFKSLVQAEIANTRNVLERLSDLLTESSDDDVTGA
jgi:hypothetical protein